MKGDDVREVIEALLPADLIMAWCDGLKVIERERKLNIC
jgi:hypothetical protein